jgi:hypothetical protein
VSRSDSVHDSWALSPPPRRWFKVGWGGGHDARPQELDPRGAHLASISGPRATQAQVQISRRTNLVILLTPPLSGRPNPGDLWHP